ncbi:MAG: arylesterase [Planctomycetota bacterium]
MLSDYNTRKRARLFGFVVSVALVSILGCAPDGEEQRVEQRKNPTAPTAPATTGPLVAFLGDSITAGLHVDEAQAFPAVLATEMRSAGTPIRLLNAGRSGDTTAGGLGRVDWILAQKPDCVVVELGGNDGLRGQPIAAITENLRQILKRIRAAGATPLLLGMRIPTNYGGEYATEFAALYAALAAELQVAFVPFFMEGVAGDPALNLPDGIHPTVAGHRKLAQNLIEPVTAVVRSATVKSE